MARWTRFRRLFGLEPAADVEAELAFHVEMRVRELVEQGETPERARRLALERFGDYEGARQECVAINERRKRHMQRTEFLTELRQDVGYAFRMLRRTPAFTAAALLTLALGIGANSAIFSVVHGVLLESLPYRDADRLHHLQMLYPDGTKYAGFSAPDYMSVRQDARVFEQIEAFDVAPQTLTGIGEPQEMTTGLVSAGLFDFLGFDVAVGRTFLPEENRAGRANVAILSQGLWQRMFGAAATALGRSLTLGGRSYTIVGVLPAEAQLPYPAEIFIPLEYNDTFDAGTARGRRSEFLATIGRARAGISAPAVEADLRRIGDHLQTTFPDSNGGLTFTSTPLREMIVGDVQRPLLVLLGAVGFVLLVACANVANLLLARGSARHGELAVRAAIGAGRARLVRQLITEAMVLGLAGGVLGLMIAYASTEALIAARPADLPRLDEIGLDSTVALFTLGAALLTGLVFGMVPALQATNEHLLSGLQESGRAAGGGRTAHRLRSALVVGEMALAVILLTGSGLLIRSFVELTRVDPGFRPDGALALRVTFQGERYAGGDPIRNRVSQIEERLRALPGVTAVASGTVLPLGGLGGLNDFAVEGAPPPPPDVNQEIAVAAVTPDYFRAIGTPLQRGRLFTELDHAKAPPVVLLNEAAVKRWFPDQDPIGRRVLSGGPREVVGVVGDVLQRNPGQPAVPQMFTPYAQRTSRTVRMIVRTQGDPLALAPAAREQIRALDANLPIADVMPLDEMVSRSIARPRFYTSLLTLFAAVALALSATGIFGVMSYTVAQQSKEIGIRMALGARAADVLRSIVGKALMLAGIGVVAGVIAALALGRLIRNQLFGVEVFDPLTIATVIAVLLTSAAMASLLPARRAAAVDPMKAFRT
ncbi:ABC transporter permease [Piscinibacter sp.]|uniref:ABC transporter permease n=1 Tax=Piscinibacter sp. TaxID=1903157 RepID=UPI002BD8BB2E|nr:ABC transporter permease [Albitalea sp.]HUG26004.1 ABC transporter permease [Albitalea sp.]